MRTTKTGALVNRVGRLEQIMDRCEAADNVEPRCLQTAQDVIDLLEEQVTAIRNTSFAGALEKARAIGQLAGIARKAIETGTLAARLEMLEAVLKQRAGKQ